MRGAVRVTGMDTLARNVSRAFGEDGRRWLARLPVLRDEVARDWGLTFGPPFPLSFHWVAPAGPDAVLKLGPPGAEHLLREAAVLDAYDGDGAVPLLRHDPERGALLLGRASPGTMLRDLVPDRDAEAAAVIAGLLRRLHRAPVPDGLPDVRSLGDDLAAHRARHGDADPLPRGYVDAAAELLTDLCDSAPCHVLLHGDLHHDNVLRDGDGWTAIDPHGWVGDPGFDAGPVLYNPDPWRRDEPPVHARVEVLAAGLGEPVERIRAWGFVAAVVSEVWDASDDSPVQTGRALQVATLLRP